MKEQYARDLVEGAKVDTLFAIRSRDLRRARTGDAYLSLEIGDRSGVVPGVMFRPGFADEAVPVGSVVRVRGTVTTYRGVRRVSIESIRPQEEFDLADLIPASIRDREELVGEMRLLARDVTHRGLRSLLSAFFGDKGFLGRFTACPGASDHHAYVGGLLEHTVAVAGACRDLSRCYPVVDHDLLVTAALLHDIGRVDELLLDTSMGSTEAGRLLGHEVLGERAVTRVVARLGARIPDDLALRLSHAILTHHTAEGGQGAGPRTVEALVLCRADALDVAVGRFTDATSGAALLQESWTDGANGFGYSLKVPGTLPVTGPCPPRVPCSTIGAVPESVPCA